jgi:hypothetical protein
LETRLGQQWNSRGDIFQCTPSIAGIIYILHILNMKKLSGQRINVSIYIIVDSKEPCHLRDLVVRKGTLTSHNLYDADSNPTLGLG